MSSPGQPTDAMPWLDYREVMFRLLLEIFADTMPTGDPEKQIAKDAWKRANRAYEDVWKTRGDLGQLRSAMQAMNVPGSFVEDDPGLQLYFEAWRQGADPQTVKADSRRALSAR